MDHSGFTKTSKIIAFDLNLSVSQLDSNSNDAFCLALTKFAPRGPICPQDKIKTKNFLVWAEIS